VPRVFRSLVGPRGGAGRPAGARRLEFRLVLPPTPTSLHYSNNTSNVDKDFGPHQTVTDHGPHRPRTQRDAQSSHASHWPIRNSEQDTVTRRDWTGRRRRTLSWPPGCPRWCWRWAAAISPTRISHQSTRVLNPFSGTHTDSNARSRSGSDRDPALLAPCLEGFCRPWTSSSPRARVGVPSSRHAPTIAAVFALFQGIPRCRNSIIVLLRRQIPRTC
jgi:hypothetical protein